MNPLFLTEFNLSESCAEIFCFLEAWKNINICRRVAQQIQKNSKKICNRTFANIKKRCFNLTSFLRIAFSTKKGRKECGITTFCHKLFHLLSHGSLVCLCVIATRFAKTSKSGHPLAFQMTPAPAPACLTHFSRVGERVSECQPT